MTDDSLFAFAPHNICNLETLRSLSPSSFEEDALTLWTVTQWEMWTNTGIKA